MRISDWSSDVCSSDLPVAARRDRASSWQEDRLLSNAALHKARVGAAHSAVAAYPRCSAPNCSAARQASGGVPRSEEHTSELQSLMRISYAVFCLKKKKENNVTRKSITTTTKPLHQK